MFPKTSSLGAALFAAAASAGSLTDVKHVVLFMQENRAFDHYFGTMAGVRGFSDPNTQVYPAGSSSFRQFDINSNVTYLSPWYWNYLGYNEWHNATRCVTAGQNDWTEMHAAYNGGYNDQWPSNSPYSMAYLKRQDVPTHWDVAEGWTIADMYQESVLAATDPNRIVWMSGTVNNKGSPNNVDGSGSIIIDNNASPGCDTAPNINCFPFTWKSIPEYWQDAGVSWQLYQDADNFEDNMLAYFDQYQKRSNNASDPLTKYGNSYIGIDKFVSDAMNGTLPEISIIIGPAELAEHPPYMPQDGAWLIKRVVDAVTKGNSVKDTALFISYDEGGGYADHVPPFVAPLGTQGEWINDPYTNLGVIPVGPGFRIPLMTISPWTRGGNVFTEPADHSSQAFFIEKWLEARGYANIESKEIPAWRRAHMSNLLSMFDFDHPDYSLPNITPQPAPLRDTSQPDPKDGLLGATSGNYIGTSKCQSDTANHYPAVPYGNNNINQNMLLLAEEGFKAVRGSLTEGRYLTFEANGYAFANAGSGKLATSPTTAKHEQISQRWIVHQTGAVDGTVFVITSATDNTYLTSSLALVQDKTMAGNFTITSLGAGKGYKVTGSNGSNVGIGAGGQIGTGATGLNVFAVTYHS